MRNKFFPERDIFYLLGEKLERNISFDNDLNGFLHYILLELIVNFSHPFRIFINFTKVQELLKRVNDDASIEIHPSNILEMKQ